MTPDLNCLNTARRLMGLNPIPKFRWYEYLLKRTAWCPYCGEYLGARWLWGSYKIEWYNQHPRCQAPTNSRPTNIPWCSTGGPPECTVGDFMKYQRKQNVGL